MTVTNTSVATFGSAAIASPPANDAAVKRDDQPAPSAVQRVEAAKPAGTGQFVDKTV